MMMAGGAAVSLDASRCAAVSLDASRCAAGDHGPVFGQAWLEGDQGQLALAADGTLTLAGRDGVAQRCDYPLPTTGYRGDSCRATQQHFVDALRDGAPFETGGAEYLRTFATVFAGYESAERGQVVDIDEFIRGQRQSPSRE
jgi:predicted dehydrogenase